MFERIWYAVRARAAEWLGRDATDRRMDEELGFHIEMETEKNVRRGMGRREARRRALVAFGGMERYRETLRKGRRLPILEELWHDLRHTFRGLRRDASWTAFVVLIVGLGIGASVTVFSVVDAMLLRPLPLASPERLVWIANAASEQEASLAEDLSALTVQVAHVENLRASSRTLEDVAGYSPFYGVGDHQLAGEEDPERATGVPVTPNFLSLLGVEPSLGRSFTAEESRYGGPPAVVLDHGFWSRRFGEDPDVVGRMITIDGGPVRVVGVLPASFDFASIFTPGDRADYFSPFPLSPETNRQGNTLALVGRLGEDGSLDAARDELSVLATRTSEGDAYLNDFVPSIRPLREHVAGAYRPAMLVLAGAVAVVMLLVCANLSNLLLTRAATRDRETSLRSALGAGRGRLIRHALVESVLLAGMGAVIGVALGGAGTRIIANLDAVRIPLIDHAVVDGNVLGFAVGTALVTGLVMGVLPALHTSTRGVGEALKEGGRGASAGRRQSRARNVLVISEVALACVLLVGAGLLLRSFQQVLAVDLGFRPAQAVSVRIDPGTRFESAADRSAYYDDALARVRAAPGVEAAGITDALPLGWTRQWSITAPGADGGIDASTEVFVRVVSDGYLRGLGVPLHSGRDLAPSDDATSRPVALVNQALSERFWPGRSPVGQMVRTWTDDDIEVVGVVGGTRHRSLEQTSGFEIYFPIRQAVPEGGVHLVARGPLAPGALTATVQGALRPMDPGLALDEARTIQERVAASVSPRRVIAWMLTGFAGLAAVLACLGIYAVVAYGVSQRGREISIRVALGATDREIRRRVLGTTTRLTLPGLVAGLLVAVAAARFLQSLLFGVETFDPPTMIGAAALLAGVALLAGYLPARRAARMDPVRALRAE